MTLFDISKAYWPKKNHVSLQQKLRNHSPIYLPLLLIAHSKGVKITMGCAVSTAAIDTSLGKDCGPPVSFRVQYSRAEARGREPTNRLFVALVCGCGIDKYASDCISKHVFFYLQRQKSNATILSEAISINEIDDHPLTPTVVFISEQEHTAAPHSDCDSNDHPTQSLADSTQASIQCTKSATIMSGTAALMSSQDGTSTSVTVTDNLDIGIVQDKKTENIEVSGAIADVAGHGEKMDLLTISDGPKLWRESSLNVKSILLIDRRHGVVGNACGVDPDSAGKSGLLQTHSTSNPEALKKDMGQVQVKGNNLQDSLALPSPLLPNCLSCRFAVWYPQQNLVSTERRLAAPSSWHTRVQAVCMLIIAVIFLEDKHQFHIFFSRLVRTTILPTQANNHNVSNIEWTTRGVFRRVAFVTKNPKLVPITFIAPHNDGEEQRKPWGARW